MSIALLRWNFFFKTILDSSYLWILFEVDCCGLFGYNLEDWNFLDASKEVLVSICSFRYLPWL